MARKIVIVALLVTFCVIGCAKGAPANEQTEILDKFMEFLHEDEQISKYQNGEFGWERLVRNKRQSEVDDMDIEANQSNDQQQAGFFDRAAKFMMELLQRFLKWINTD